MENWRLLNSEQLIVNQWLGVRQDECLTAQGARVDRYFVVQKSDYVMIVAITRGGELLLVRQYKHPAGEVVVECPAGYVNPGEEPIAAAARELYEETGYRPGTLRPLGDWFSSPAVLTNRAHFFLCTEAEREGEPQFDHAEEIELVTVDFQEALRRLPSGALVSDVSSAAAILLASRALAADGGKATSSGRD